MNHAACLVLGCAPCMWDDLERAPKIRDVMAVNRAGTLYLDPIRHWTSAHGIALVEWIKERERLGGDMNFQAFGNFTQSQDSGRVERRNWHDWGGTSSLYAVRVALDAGWVRVVLCGVPLTGKEGLTRDGRIVYESGYETYQKPWSDHIDLLRDNVRSMSGWTRELLGEPTADWLSE